jgi:CBS domain-containing membrane protein
MPFAGRRATRRYDERSPARRATQRHRYPGSSFFLAHMTSLSVSERWRSTLGALVGVGLCAGMLFALPVGSHWLIAPMGASAVIVFALSHSPLAQPWPVIGSYLVATIAGLICANLIPVPQIAVAVAVAASIWLMAKFNCVHPPGGAVALFIALEGPHSAWQMEQTVILVAQNLLVLLLATLLVNNLVLRRRYPYSVNASNKNKHQTRDATPLNRTALNHADLESAVKTLDTFVDVQEDELVQLYNLAVDHAFERHVGLTCGEIMSRDVVTVHFDTGLEEAWTQLRLHKIRALPVVDSFDRLIGILTVADFLRQMDETSAAGLAVRLQGLLRRTPGPNSDKAEVVGQIMTAQVYSARIDTPVAELVHQMAENSLPHIPVIDEKRKVLGVVTQTDTLAALYKRIALSTV